MVNHSLIYTIFVYSFIFFLWSTWEYLKYLEHEEKKGFWRLQFKFYNILVYFSTTYATLSLFVKSRFEGYWLLENAEFIAIVVIAFSIVSLRVSKSASKEGTPLARIKQEIVSLLIGNDVNRD
jgi:hypothetical protein